jgi:hypothetical protein
MRKSQQMEAGKFTIKEKTLVEISQLHGHWKKEQKKVNEKRPKKIIIVLQTSN